MIPLPSQAEIWPSIWRAALATSGVEDDHPAAEKRVVRLIRKYRLAPASPGLPVVRAAIARLARSARAIDEDLATLDAAEAGTPHRERRVIYGEIFDEALAVLNLSPAGRHGWEAMLWSWRHTADRLDTLVEEDRLNSLPPVGPRAPSVALDTLIGGLAEVYYDLTGRKASAWWNSAVDFTPPFVVFIGALWPAIGDGQPPSVKQVNGALRRANQPFDRSNELQAVGMCPASDAGTQEE